MVSRSAIISHAAVSLLLLSLVCSQSIFDYDVEDSQGLTDRDYKELQMLYSKYASRGLEILAFPCNDFGQQEPSSNGEIARFVASKGVNFPVLGKLSCGSVADAHPLYQFLMSATSGPLTWNFEKILCDRHGVPFRRFTPRESPLSFEGEIVKLLDGESEF